VYASAGLLTVREGAGYGGVGEGGL
jgi:hypothetical protein